MNTELKENFVNYQEHRCWIQETRFLAVVFPLPLLNRVNCLFDRKILVMTSELYENFLLVNKEAR